MTAETPERVLRILIVDDHPIVRDGIAGAINRQPDLEVVAEASNGAEAVERYSAMQPDVVLMDLQMPGMDGLEAITRIRSQDRHAKLLVLTTYSGDVRAIRALKAGAAGYLLKSAVRSDLVDAIRAVHAGRFALPPQVAGEIAIHAVDSPPSGREVEVLTCLARGESNKQIAYRLSIAEETVKTHLKSIFTKLGVTDRTAAVTIAAKRGIIEL